MPNYPAWMQQNQQTQFRPMYQQSSTPTMNQRSMIGQNPAANYQYNVPTAYQMFPLLAQNPMIQSLFANMSSPNMGAMTPAMGMQGQYGAGRFLGGNTGLLGGNSTSMLGS